MGPVRPSRPPRRAPLILEERMATKLDKTIKRELELDGQALYGHDVAGRREDHAEGSPEGAGDDLGHPA